MFGSVPRAVASVTTVSGGLRMLRSLPLAVLTHYRKTPRLGKIRASTHK